MSQGFAEGVFCSCQGTNCPDSSVCRDAQSPKIHRQTYGQNDEAKTDILH